MCLISCDLRATRQSHKIVRAWNSLEGEFASVMMDTYRMNWQVLVPVFVEYVEPEDTAWNLRVHDDDDGCIFLECLFIEVGFQHPQPCAFSANTMSLLSLFECSSWTLFLKALRGRCTSNLL